MIDVRKFGGLDTFFVGGVEASVADVFHDGVGEEESILQDDAELFTQVIFGDVADVLSVNRDAAGIDLIEASQQVDDGGFACTCGTDERDGLSCLCFESHIFDDELIGVVAERDVSEVNFSFEGNRQGGVRSGVQFHWCIDNFEDAFRTRQRGLDRVVHVCQLSQGLDEILGICDESRDHANRHKILSAKYPPRPAKHDDEEIAEHLR